MAGSPPVGQFVNPVVITPAFINPVVVSQVVLCKSRKMPAARARPGANAADHMVGFASPAARVLRSVRSRWQTGWRSARARADHRLWSLINEHPLSNLYHGRSRLS